MTNVKSFKINGIDSSINIANNLENGLMSSTDHGILVDVYNGTNLNTSTSGENVYPNEVFAVSENPEFIYAKTDTDGKLIETIDYDGNKTYYTDINIEGQLAGVTIDALNSSINAILDNDLSELTDNVNFNTRSIDDISTKVYSTQKELDYFNIAIDPCLGVLRIGGKTYKLISYEGDASFDEYVDTTSFVDSVEYIDSSEFSSVITDSEYKILYGIYTDSTETDIDLYGITVADPSTGDIVTLSSVVNSLK